VIVLVVRRPTDREFVGVGGARDESLCAVSVGRSTRRSSQREVAVAVRTGGVGLGHEDGRAATSEMASVPLVVRLRWSR